MPGAFVVQPFILGCLVGLLFGAPSLRAAESELELTPAEKEEPGLKAKGKEDAPEKKPEPVPGQPAEADEKEALLQQERLNRFPEFPYYPSKPVPGYPGFRQPFPKMPPEYIPYPGSVQHFRHWFMKYLFALHMYNHRSLVRNWLMREHCADTPDRLTQYAEKIYRYLWPNDREWETRSNRSETTEFADPVTVLRLRPGESIKPLAFGPLSRGLHVLRVIAALRPEDDVFPPKEMLFRLTVNDRLDGGDSAYVLRGRTMCNFYSAVEFFFHAVDQRAFRATLTYLPESETDLFVYNVDLHTTLAEMDLRGLKRRQTLAANVQVNEMIDRILREEAGDGHRFDAERACQLWQSLPPLNTMFAICPITWAPANPKKAFQQNRVNLEPRMWRLTPLKQDPTFRLVRSETAAQLDDVKAPKEAKANPDSLREEGKAAPDELTLDEKPKAETAYAWKDLTERKPLPGTRDCGCGERVKGAGGAWRYNADLPIAAAKAYQDAALGEQSLAQMAGGAGATKDALFEAAFRFAAFAYQVPSLAHTHHLPIQVNIWQPDRLPNHVGYGMGLNPDSWCVAYEALFPYVARSQKLARALHEFIPGIESPDDVVRLFDTYLAQYVAKLYRYYHLYWGHDTAPACIRLATLMNNAEASRPLMDWLSRNCWIYPQALGGFMDNWAIGSTRDGGSTIGSFFYGQTVHLDFVEMMDRYVAASGDKTYDLSDWTRFPKAHAALTFPIRARVAGYYHPGIGDVAGPSRPYTLDRESVLRAARLLYERTGNAEYAHLIAEHGRRTTETPEEWAKIEKLAQTARDPLLAARSRVLPEWQAVLESGYEFDDPRAHAAASLRIGTGTGHGHADTMDLRLWAHGLCMVGDAGMRPDYGRPDHTVTRVHNLVEVNERSHATHAWVRTLADLPGAHYLRAEAAYPDPKVTLYARQVLLVQAADGTIRPGPATQKDDPAVVTPEHYVFDVFRVRGGLIHTYCFHGSVDDAFEVNVPKRQQPHADLRKYLDGYYYDAKYYQLLRDAYKGTGAPKKDVEGFMKGEDTESALEDEAQKKTPELYEPWTGRCDGDDLVATWRLEATISKSMIAGAAAPTGPRKFTRLTLFDQKDSTILHGLCINDPYRNVTNPTVPYYAVRQVYARRAGYQYEIESVFVALIEPYAGEPEVISRRLVRIEGNESDAERAVAVEVKTKGGRTDLCFADGRPDKERAIEGGVCVAAEAAFLSRDAAGLRQASVTGGRFLKAPDVGIVPACASYAAKIRIVDFAKLRLALDMPLPARSLAGQCFEVGNDLRKTGYTVPTLETRDGTSTLVLDEATELFRSRVVFVYDDVVRLATARFLPHGAGKGLTATDEGFTKVWRAEALPGGNRWNGFGYKLSGAPLDKKDFPPGSGLVVHEVGPGDTVSAKTFVSLQRREPGLFAVAANVKFALRLKGVAAARVSADGRAWAEVPAQKDAGWLVLDLDPESIGAREFQLRMP
jgi:hypothetical protein